MESLELLAEPQRRNRDGDAAASARRERRLVSAAQRESSEAFGQLVRLHWRRAHRAAYLVTHDAAAAEDISQEAFLAALRTLDRFDRGRPFGPWLHRIVVNRAIDWTRKRGLRREVLGDRSAGHADSSDSPATAAPLGDDVVAALARLAPEQRAAIVMRYLLDFTPGEIAAALDLPRGTVNSRLRRGLDRLAGALEAGR